MNSSRHQDRTPDTSASLENVEEVFTSQGFDTKVTSAPGSFNDEHLIRGLVSDTIRRCKKSREAIAEEMSYLLGTTVTKRAIDSYTSEASDQNRWPAQYTRAFCHVTSDWRLLHCVAERSGYTVMSASQLRIYELGRQLLLRNRSQAAIARLEAELLEVPLG